MLMVTIYTSKLFLDSKRKEHIRSAVGNPINMELIAQMPEYIDEKFADLEFKEKPKDSEEEALRNGEAEIIDSEGSDNSRVVVKHSDMGMDMPSEEPPMQEQSSESSEPVGESVKLSNDSDSVHASVGFISPTIDNEDELKSRLDTLLGTLNMRSDCSGVVRIVIRNKELWIYYSDKINLNNVMEPVIKVLYESGYKYLDFNRLARTDNAIVFEILDAVAVEYGGIADGE